MTTKDLIDLLLPQRINIVDFWAPWCGPCRVIGPILESIASEYQHVNLVKINVDENGDLAREFEIKSIPTILFMDASGNVLSTSIGAKDKQSLVAMINSIDPNSAK